MFIKFRPCSNNSNLMKSISWYPTERDLGLEFGYNVKKCLHCLPKPTKAQCHGLKVDLDINIYNLT